VTWNIITIWNAYYWRICYIVYLSKVYDIKTLLSIRQAQRTFPKASLFGHWVLFVHMKFRSTRLSYVGLEHRPGSDPSTCWIFIAIQYPLSSPDKQYQLTLQFGRWEFWRYMRYYETWSWVICYILWTFLRWYMHRYWYVVTRTKGRYPPVIQRNGPCETSFPFLRWMICPFQWLHQYR
jgi:hypothetical protein